MELFFAGGPNNNIFIKFYEKTHKKVNILKNYYELMDRDFKKEILSYKPYVDKIMLDSGAFSANNSLNPKEAEIIKCRYPYFLKQNKDFLEGNIYRVFTYDIHFDKKDYQENFILYLDLKDAFENICPVIHRYTEYVDNIEVDTYSPFSPPTIAIGQIISNNKRDNRTNQNNISKLQATINSIKNVNSDCHLLGISEFKALNTLKHYDTSDSKSWMDFATSGTVQIFWPPDATNAVPVTKMIKIPQYLKDENNSASIYKIPDYERTKFFDEMKEELQLEERDFNNSSSTESLMLANLYYFTKMVDYLNNEPIQSAALEVNPSSSESKIPPPLSINKNPFAPPKKTKAQSNIIFGTQNQVTKDPF